MNSIFIKEEDPNGIASRRHFAIEVEDIVAIREQLSVAGVRIEETVAIYNRPRFLCFDPAGNMIEITQITGDYLGNPGGE